MSKGILNYDKVTFSSGYAEMLLGNPFNPSTRIKFSIAGVKEQHIRLIIYDTIGQMVSTLIDNNLKPGSYETDWDASIMPSGIYFYTIDAGSFVDSKKMILIK